MKSPFKHFDASGRLLPEQKPKLPIGKSDYLEAVVFEVEALAESATFFFRGYYPKEAPYFSWGKCIELAWADHYWAPSGEDELRPLPIESELAAMVQVIRGAWDEMEEHRLTFVLPFFDSPKLKLQGLAAELLFHLDRFLDVFFYGEHAESTALLLECTKYISDLTLEAIDQLERGDPAATVINRIREGAVRGGLASAESRRQMSRVPSPAALREERARLIADGKAERDVAGILAMRYRCSADHIRKTLLRD